MGKLKTLTATAVASAFTALSPVSAQVAADKRPTAKEACDAFDEKVRLDATSAEDIIEKLLAAGAKIKMAPTSVKSLDEAKRASADGRVSGHGVKFLYTIASDKASGAAQPKPATLCTGTFQGTVSTYSPDRPKVYAID